jgi:multiple sugar transport system substrate-binding protein
MKLFKVRFILSLWVLFFFSIGFAQIELDYWHGFTGPDLPIMEQLVADFNESQSDIVVTAQAIPWGELFQQIEPSVAAGQAPDIVALNEDVITSFILRGAIQEITPDVLSSAGIDSSLFYESLWNVGTVNGSVYGVPIHSVMLVMYYNKDLFEAAGLDPENPPQTREEFLEAARALTIDASGLRPGEEGFDPNNLTQWAVGIPTPWMGGTIAYTVAAQNGVTFVGNADESYPANFDSAESQEAVQFLVDLVNTENVSPTNATEQSEIDAFRAGQAAMNFNGVWMLSQYQGQEGLNFGVAPFPNLGTGEYKVWGGSSHLALPVQRNGTPEEQAAAATFIAWMTQPEQNLAWTAAGGLPTQSAVAEGEGYASNPMTAISEALPNTFVLTGFPFISQFRTAWDTAFASTLLGEKDTATALTDGVNEANSRIQDGLRSLPPTQ